MKYGRILLAAIASEILAVVSLVVAVAVFGPSDPGSAERFARETGSWLGPVAGFAFTLAAAWIVSRKLQSGHVQTGFAIGAAAALLDVLLLIAGGEGFQTLFVFSNLGRVLAGVLGGWMAARRA